MSHLANSLNHPLTHQRSFHLFAELFRVCVYCGGIEGVCLQQREGDSCQSSQSPASFGGQV